MDRLRVGGSVFKLFSVLVLRPKLLELLLFNLKVNHLSKLWVELSNASEHGSAMKPKLRRKLVSFLDQGSSYDITIPYRIRYIKCLDL